MHFDSAYSMYHRFLTILIVTSFTTFCDAPFILPYCLNEKGPTQQPHLNFALSCDANILMITNAKLHEKFQSANIVCFLPSFHESSSQMKTLMKFAQAYS